MMRLLYDKDVCVYCCVLSEIVGREVHQHQCHCPSHLAKDIQFVRMDTQQHTLHTNS